MKWIIIPLIGAVLLFGCAKTGGNGQIRKPGLQKEGEGLQVENEPKDINAVLSKEDGELVITLDWGRKPTGGYVLKILSAREEGDNIIVEYFAKAPGPNDIVTQAITYPKDTKKIKVSDINKEYNLVLKFKEN